jgi:hypothetical protein
MIRHGSLVLIALFWVVMNGLLWRSEFGGGSKVAATVPPSTVWEKVLTAPDDSSLSININGKRLGYLRIHPRVSEAAPDPKITNPDEIEGIVRQVSGYNFQVEGSLVAEMIGRSVRFDSESVFDPNFSWQGFRAEATIRPNRWEIKANATDREVWLQSTDGQSEWIHSFPFEDFRNPERLLRQVESPILATLLPQILSAVATTNTAAPSLSLGLKWETRMEWLRIGRSRVRIYRAEAKLLDQYRIIVLISRVGEILRIELPGEIKLINEVLYAS